MNFTVETETPRSLNIGPLALELRLDRIDSFADGAQLVIDYKTGELQVNGDWRGERLAECQLPLYAVTTGSRGVAVLQFTPSGVVVYGVGDPVLGLECLKTPEKFFSEPDLDWAGVVVRWRNQLEQLAAEFAAGDFRVDPTAPKKAAGQFAVLTGVYSGGARMKIADSAPDEPLRERALAPDRSFLVQAPAGAGKTELLIQRYLRLLSCCRRAGRNPRHYLHAQSRSRDAAADLPGTDWRGDCRDCGNCERPPICSNWSQPSAPVMSCVAGALPSIRHVCASAPSTA